MSENRHRPFVHRVSREDIERFRAATPEQRLQWLDEAFRFVMTAVPPKKREMWERYVKAPPE